MVRKIKTSEVNIENVSYDAVVESVSKVDDVSVEEPVKQETVPDVGQYVDLVPNVGEQVESLEDVKNVPVEKKVKKEMEKGTCEKCGKTMSLKSLKYAHSKKCNVKTDTELKEEIHVKTENVLKDEIPPKPLLIRSDSNFIFPEKIEESKTVVESIPEESGDVVEVPAAKSKPKTKRSKKVLEPVVVPPSEPVVMKKSRAVLKAEKYTALAANALP